MLSPHVSVLFLTLAVVSPVVNALTAPKAWCFTDNSKPNNAPQSSSPPADTTDNIALSWFVACEAMDNVFINIAAPDGRFTSTYNTSSADNNGPGAACRYVQTVVSLYDARSRVEGIQAGERETGKGLIHRTVISGMTFRIWANNVLALVACCSITTGGDIRGTYG